MLSPSLHCSIQADRNSSVSQCYHAHRKSFFQTNPHISTAAQFKTKDKNPRIKNPSILSKMTLQYQEYNLVLVLKEDFLCLQRQNYQQYRSLGKSCLKLLTAMPPLTSTSGHDHIVISTLKGQQFYLLSLFIQNRHGH